MKATLLALVAALIVAAPAAAQTTGTAGDATPVPEVPTPTRQGLYFKPDAGIVYQTGDFRLTAWGFAERLTDPSGPDYFRRVRQGAEIDLPRIGDHLRIAGVYEIDLTDTNAFGINPGPAGSLNSYDFENLFIAVQDADDPARFRVLFGHNTSILSRDDNLSSGNLPTINRSLILRGTRLDQHVRRAARRSGAEDAIAKSDGVGIDRRQPGRTQRQPSELFVRARRRRQDRADPD